MIGVGDGDEDMEAYGELNTKMKSMSGKSVEMLGLINRNQVISSDSTWIRGN